MEIPQLAVKTIPKGSFFELYNELSHREPEKLITPAPSYSSKSHPEDTSKNLRSSQLTPSKDQKVPKISFYSEKSDPEEHPAKSFMTRERPPSELIAIDIPLKSSEETAEFAESQSSLHSSFNSISVSRYDQSFEVPKIPKSLNSFDKPSKASSSSLKLYMDKLKDLDSFENSEEQLVEMLRNTKNNSFDNILELIFSECSGKAKVRGCLFIKCGREGKITDHQKLDFFYQTLGTVKFEVNKLMHRCLLKKFLVEATQSEEILPVASWKKIGFPDDINDFFSQTGSPLAFIMAIHVVEMVSSAFWRSTCEAGVPFLDICFQLSIEAYQLSKSPKLKKFFSESVVPNYFKLAAAGILSFFMVKSSRGIESLDLLKKTVEQMKENHEFLIESIDSSILKSSN